MTTVLSPVATPDPGDTLTAAVNTALARLAELGSPDRIAEHLRGEFIRGICGDPGQCAIAAYLDHAVPRVRNAALYVDSAMWSIFDPRTESLDRRGRMPELVAKFIRRFDAGGFPELRRLDSPACPATSPF